MSDYRRQEFKLLSDVLGVSILLDAIKKIKIYTSGLEISTYHKFENLRINPVCTFVVFFVFIQIMCICFGGSMLSQFDSLERSLSIL